MISVVNGYVCTSSCEAANARQGENPTAPSGAPSGQSDKTDKTSGFAGQPATVLGGALKDLGAANGGRPASNSAPTNQPLLNTLA
jgi:hypothetical protein